MLIAVQRSSTLTFAFIFFRELHTASFSQYSMSRTMSNRQWNILIYGAAAVLFLFCTARNIIGLSFATLIEVPTSLWPKPGAHQISVSLPSSSLIPPKSRTYVVSLSHRTDRREQMDVLRASLRLNWTYIDATGSQEVLVSKILQHVGSLRNDTRTSGQSRNTSDSTSSFWPENIDTISASDEPIFQSGSDLWILSNNETSSSSPPLTCVTENDVIPPYSSKLPPFRLLSLGRIACWKSHLEVIRRVANAPQEDEATIILEDDVDMEWDIQKRLDGLWNLLPHDWDIVFLGMFYTPPGNLNSSILNSRPLLVERITFPSSGTHTRFIEPIYYPPTPIIRPEMHSRVCPIATRSSSTSTSPLTPPLRVFSCLRSSIFVACVEREAEELLRRSQRRSAEENRRQRRDAGKRQSMAGKACPRCVRNLTPRKTSCNQGRSVS